MPKQVVGYDPNTNKDYKIDLPDGYQYEKGIDGNMHLITPNFSCQINSLAHLEQTVKTQIAMDYRRSVDEYIEKNLPADSPTFGQAT